MAQSTAGIKVYYGESTVTDGVPVIPSSWTEIPDITSTPAMNAAPAKIDTTTLAELRQKTYINGLMDLGGSFEFKANMTPELVEAANAAAADAATGKARAFSIVFPAPLSKRYWWTGEVLPVAPGEAAVDAAATTTLYISQATALIEVDEDEVS
jgi:hypothetical protein